MRVAVIGAGVIGTALAWRLARAGLQVTVLETQDAAGQGSSYANAGLLSPGHCFSWAAPGVPTGLLSDWRRGAPPLSGRDWLDPDALRWCLAFLRECGHGRWRANSLAALKLALYSRELQLRETLPAAADYDHARRGLLYLYPDMASLGCSGRELALLAQAGVPHRIVQGEALRALAPGLLSGAEGNPVGVLCPGDGSGDAHRYARACADAAGQAGAVFRYGVSVLALEAGAGGRIQALRTTAGTITADAYVVCAGVAAPGLLRPLGYYAPIRPVIGYSLDMVQAAQDGEGPTGLVFLADKIACTRLGARRRLTGYADFSWPSPSRQQARFEALLRLAERLWPGEPWREGARRWVGQRPMTPTGLPWLGRASHENLYFNCGHGAMGWTMAVGSAQLILDLLQERPPGLDLGVYAAPPPKGRP